MYSSLPQSVRASPSMPSPCSLWYMMYESMVGTGGSGSTAEVRSGGVQGAHGQEQTALPSLVLQLNSQPPRSPLHWSWGMQMPVVLCPPSCQATHMSSGADHSQAEYLLLSDLESPFAPTSSLLASPALHALHGSRRYALPARL